MKTTPSHRPLRSFLLEVLPEVVGLEEQEQNDSSWLKTINYAPGPLETDMVTQIRQAEDLDSHLKPNFDKQLLDPDDSAEKLIRLLISDGYDSGAHIDYYDLPEN